MVVSDIYQSILTNIGTCAQQTVFNILTYAIKALANKAPWNPLQVWIELAVGDDHLVILPDFVETPLRVNINRNPAFFHNRLFQFRQGTDVKLGDEVGWNWADRGEIPVNVKVVETPGQLRASQASVIRAFGLDVDGKEIFDSLGEPGYVVTASNAGPIFKEITAIKKFASTVYVDLYHNDVKTASYSPREQSPSFKRIKLSKSNCNLTILAKKKTYKVESMEDWIPLDDELAIILMAKSINLRLKGQELDSAKSLEADAIALLTDAQTMADSNTKLSDATEVVTVSNRTYQTRDLVVVSDIYDRAEQIFGGIGKQALFDRITKATVLLSNKGCWDALLGWLDLVPANKYNEYTLPWFVGTVEAVTVGKHPSYPQGKWFEFHQNGSGGFTNYHGIWRDGGESPCFKDIVKPSKIAVVLDSQLDNNATVKVWGYDASGKNIDAYVPPALYGFPLPDANCPLFAQITRVEKSEASQGYIKVVAIDEGTTDGTVVSLMYPEQLQASYRRIKLSAHGQDIRLQIKKKTAKIMSLTDVIPLTNILALEMALQAVKFYDDKDYQNASNAEEKATQMLEEEENARNPQTIIPVQIDSHFAPGSMRNIR